MKHVRSLEEAKLDTASVVTIGVFDGVHIGHQTLIKRLVANARASNRLAAVITFFPHPDKLLRQVDKRYYLTTPKQRASLMLALGVDCVITHPFNAAIRQMPAADFVEQLVKHLKVKELWVGADFALGYQRGGNVEFLTAQGQERGFRVSVIELMMSAADDKVIRSSQVREHVRRGSMDKVKTWLGRSYALAGKVVHGEKRGAAIGFPTANIEVWSEQIIPANGVYAGWARLGGETFKAAINIGIRPTFEGDSLSIEAHLLDFDRDIYGRQLEVTFEARLRPEKKFDSLEALVTQIGLDVDAARDYLGDDASLIF